MFTCDDTVEKPHITIILFGVTYEDTIEYPHTQSHIRYNNATLCYLIGSVHLWWHVRKTAHYVILKQQIYWGNVQYPWLGIRTHKLTNSWTSSDSITTRPGLLTVNSKYAVCICGKVSKIITKINGNEAVDGQIIQLGLVVLSLEDLLSPPLTTLV